LEGVAVAENPLLGQGKEAIAFSIRGAARLLGINDKSLSAENLAPKLSQTLTEKGFQVRSFGSQGIPDTAFALIAEY